MEPVGLLVYWSFSGDVTATSEPPTIWQWSGVLGVSDVPIPWRIVADENGCGLMCILLVMSEEAGECSEEPIRDVLGQIV